LRGRKAAAGSIGRVPAVEIENAVRSALETYQPRKRSSGSPLSIGQIERVVIAPKLVRITAAGAPDMPGQEFEIPWSPKTKDTATVEGNGPVIERNEGLIQSIVRAHAWMHSLQNETYDSIEQLSEANNLHPKVVRQNLRLAFLSPDATSAILEGSQPAELSLARIPKLLPLPWSNQRPLLG
jgi:site-specific DNA recombinase